jgi:hypothetical protein
VNGAQEGRTAIYYPSGQIKEVQHFIAGKKEGGDTLWYEDGKIQFVTTLKNDKKDGYLRKWNPAGDLIYEAKFSLDTLSASASERHLPLVGQKNEVINLQNLTRTSPKKRLARFLPKSPAYSCTTWTALATR